MNIPNQLKRLIPPTARRWLMGERKFTLTPKEREDRIALRQNALDFIQSENYRLLVKGPIDAELEKMKPAYKIESMKESWLAAGKHEGLTFVDSYLQRLIREGDFAEEEQEREAKQKQLENNEIDSREL